MGHRQQNGDVRLSPTGLKLANTNFCHRTTITFDPVGIMHRSDMDARYRFGIEEDYFLADAAIRGTPDRTPCCRARSITSAFLNGLRMNAT